MGSALQFEESDGPAGAAGCAEGWCPAGCWVWISSASLHCEAGIALRPAGCRSKAATEGVPTEGRRRGRSGSDKPAARKATTTKEGQIYRGYMDTHVAARGEARRLPSNLDAELAQRVGAPPHAQHVPGPATAVAPLSRQAQQVVPVRLHILPAGGSQELGDVPAVAHVEQQTVAVQHLQAGVGCGVGVSVGGWVGGWVGGGWWRRVGASWQDGRAPTVPAE